jgi:glycosyltransferase involved in cell wall biosynthesis
MEIAKQVIARRLSKTTFHAQKHDLTDFLLWKELKQEQRILRRQDMLRRIGIQVKVAKLSGPKRLLYVSNASGFSGGEESLCQLVATLDPNQYHKSALIAMKGHLVQKLQQAGAAVICPNQDFASNTVDNFLFLLQVIKDVGPDIVHFNSSPGMPALVAVALLGIPVVQHLRVSSFDESYLESLKTAQAVIAVSEFVRSAASKHDVLAGDIHVVYNGVDTVQFRPGLFDKLKSRQEFNLRADAKIALMVARFVPKKRHDIIIRAAEIVKKSLRSFQLVLVGGDQLFTPQYYERIKRQVSEAGLNHCVSILGFQEDIRKIEAAADVVVLCSDKEPLSRCTLEAMAMGIPVVVTDSDGKQEIVMNNIDGFVVPSGNYTELATKITAILTNDQLTAKFTKAAREKIEQKFSIGYHAREIKNVYDQVLAKAHLVT